MHRATMVSLLLLFIFRVDADALQAQERIRAEVQVIQIAADQIYLELDTEDLAMPKEGAILLTYRDADYLGSLELMAAFPPRLLVRYAETVFPLTRGEIITLEWGAGVELGGEIVTGDEAGGGGVSGADPGADTDATAAEGDSLGSDRRSILDRPVTRGSTTRFSRSSRQRQIPQWSGRVLLGTRASQSVTNWGGQTDESNTRYSSISYSNLSFRGRDLPGGWSVQAQGRLSYRVQTGSFRNDNYLMNIYNLKAAKVFDSIPLEVQIGRFYNRFEMMHSFWDGAMAHLQMGNWGGGLTGGFQPVRTTEGLSFSYPKAGGYLHYRLRTESVRWTIQANAAGVFPSNEAFRSYAGIEQKFRYDGVGMDTEFQAHRHPDSAEWRWTRMRFRAFADLSEQLEVRASYQRRISYSPFRTFSEFSHTRNEYGLTATLSASNWRFIQGMRWNHQPEAKSTSYQSRVQWNRSPLWDISWSVYGYYWNGQERGSSLNSGVTASKSLEKWRLQSGLSAYRSNFVNNRYTQGSLFLNADYRLTRDLSVQARYQGVLGEFTSQNALSLSLWKSF